MFIECLNLTAQDNNATLIDRLAGYAAFCKANAFLEIMVGDNTSNDGKGTKYVNDKVSYVANSLSPNFFKYWELEADLPQDWKLTINVRSHVEGTTGDTLIGSTIIDLEDRYLGEYRTRQLIKYKSLESYYLGILKDLEGNNNTNDNNEKVINKINKYLAFINTKMDELKPLQVPVEYRPLLKSGTKTAQGIIEMFVEVFPQNIAKMIKPAKIEPPPPEEYELRLIIWETRGVPIGNNVTYSIKI